MPKKQEKQKHKSRNSAKAAPQRERGSRSTKGRGTSSKPTSTRGSQRESRVLRAQGKHELELDWSMFDGGKDSDRFEDLGLDICAEVFGEENLTRNARRRGKDGGADGLARVRRGRDRGEWKIACAVRQSFSAARTKVIKENKLARESGASGLLFITSFDATALQTRELKQLAEAGLSGADVWSRSKLAALLKGSWLRQEYFHHQAIPGFVPIDHAAEIDDKNQPDIALVGRVTEKAQLRDAVVGKPRIGVIWAPGGAGKSRLLRDVANIIADVQPRRSSWLRRPGQGTIEESLRSGLPAKRPLCLVLDDAGLEPSEVRELARLATSNVGPDVKAIFAIRSVDRDAMRQLLGSWRDAVAWIELTPLTEEDGARVAQSECAALTVEDAKKVARMFGSNLFLLRAAAQSIARGDAPGNVVNDDHLRGMVARRMIDEVAANLKALPAAGGGVPLLAELALNGPLPFTRVGEDVVVRVLYEARLLRRVGNTLRFRRDVEGDILLAYFVEQAGHRAVVKALLAASNDDLLARQVRNLGSAGRGNAATLLAQIVRGWRMSESFPQSVGRLLPLLPYCAQAAPEEAVEFCVAAASQDFQRFDSDSFGPVILQVGAASVARAFTLAGTLLDLGVPEGRYSNFHRHSIASSLLSPVFHSPAQLHEACHLLEEWLQAPGVGNRAGLIGAAIDALLSPVAVWDTSDGKSLTMYERALPASPPILDLRRAAVRLLSKMLQHPDREARLQAALVLDRHGVPHLGRVSTAALDDAAANEFELLAPIVEVRLSAESDVEVLFRIYEGLAMRWAADRPGADLAARLLRGRVFAPIVKAYHYASVAKEWFYSFDDVLAAAPADVEQRWPWWVSTYLMSRTNSGECERVVDDLCAAYTTVDEALRCVSVLANTKNPSCIIDMWCSRAPALFEAALAVAGPAELARLQSTVRRYRYRIRPDSVQDELLALPMPLVLAEVRGLLADAAIAAITAPTATAVGQYLVAQPDVEFRRLGLEVVQHRSDIGAASVLRLLEEALRDGDWSEHWRDIWSVLYSADGQAIASTHIRLRERIEAVVVAGKSSFDEEWHQRRVLDMLYADDHVRILDLLERLAKQTGYHAVNKVGRLLVPLIVAKARFAAVVDRLVRWVTELGASAVEWILEAAFRSGAQLPEGTDDIAITMLRSDGRGERVVGLLLLAHMPASAMACAAIAELAVDAQDELNELAKKELWSFSLPQRVWSRSIGEPAPAFLELQHTLREAASRASLAARPLIIEVLRYLENHLAAEASQDEEDLDPR